MKPPIFSHAKAELGERRLSDGTYRGKGLLIGLNQSGTKLLQLAWLAGRSGSAAQRQRYEVIASKVRGRDTWYAATVQYDKDSNETNRYISLRSVLSHTAGAHAVHYIMTTSNRTDVIARHIVKNEDLRFSSAYEPEMRGSLRTPRVSAELIVPTIEDVNTRQNPVYSIFGKQLTKELSEPYRARPLIHGVLEMLAPGVGLCATQYDGNDTDGKLQIFRGMPFAVPLKETITDTATDYADTILGAEHCIAIIGQAINLNTRLAEAPFVINRYAL